MIIPFESSEYIRRQTGLMQQIPPSSVVFIPTNDLSYRSNDVSFPFRPNSYFLYLCGWVETDSILVLTKDSEDYISTLFVSPRNTSKEIWEGVRLGVEGALDWPVNDSESIDNFEIRLAELTKGYQNIFSILLFFKICLLAPFPEPTSMITDLFFKYFFIQLNLFSSKKIEFLFSFERNLLLDSNVLQDLILFG